VQCGGPFLQNKQADCCPQGCDAM